MKTGRLSHVKPADVGRRPFHVRSTIVACPTCNSNEYRAERVDAWNAAYALLNSKDWGDDYGPACPADVVRLAEFLDGAGSE